LSRLKLRQEQFEQIVALSLAFFPDLISFAWNVVVASVNYIPDVIQAISAFPIPNSCTGAGCVSRFLDDPRQVCRPCFE
jgi:hypothetical protein